MIFRKLFSLVLIVALCASCLGGCGSEAGESSGKTLWVLTEQSTSDGMNYQAERIAERMMEADSDLTVRLEILPTDFQQREIALKELRAQIMAGKGPDVYLLSTGGSLLIDYPFFLDRGRKHVRIEPLFRDVPLAMQGGLFADLQPYFQEDGDGLKEEIMNAGVLEGKRYVLPLRYTVPVILTAPEDWQSCGLNIDVLNAGVKILADTALLQATPSFTVGLQLPGDMSLLPALSSGESGEICPSAGELADYMRLYQKLEAVARKGRENLLSDWQEHYDALVMADILKLRLDPELPTGWEWRVYNDTRYFNSAREYSYFGRYWRTAGMPLLVCRLADTLETLAIAKVEGTEVELFPLRAMDGAIVADVTYYGAVGSSCKNPELAYQFLRQFLTEEFQWDLARPRLKKGGNWENRENDKQRHGQLEDSWPVRAEGATPYLWDSLRYQLVGTCYIGLVTDLENKERSKKTASALQKVKLSDEDLPALSWPIDRVRFPVTLPEEESFEHALSLLNNEDGTPTDVDIDNLSQQVYQKLWFHVMEG